MLANIGQILASIRNSGKGKSYSLIPLIPTLFALTGSLLSPYADWVVPIAVFVVDPGSGPLVLVTTVAYARGRMR